MTTNHDTCSNCQHLRDQLAEKTLRIQALEASIEDLIRHDALTGVFNLRAMHEFLTSEIQRSLRTGHPFCFMIIDLDDFDEINDHYGRETGDRVLALMATTLNKLLRGLDRFARIGDDEFGIMLPASWLEQGALAVNRLTEAINGCDWESISPGLKLRFSGGLTTNAPLDTSQKIIERAEKALHQAKHEGKNRTVQIEEPLPPMVLDDD